MVPDADPGGQKTYGIYRIRNSGLKNSVGDAGLGMDNGGGPAVAATNGLENLTGQVVILVEYTYIKYYPVRV
jgi:hypothetical protein